jgi:Two component regulator propeller
VYDTAARTLSLLPNTEEDKVMNQIIDSRVVSIIKDSIEGRPVLLVSPYGHYLAYYDLLRHRWISRLDSSRKIIQTFGLKDNLIHKFLKTSTGQIWLANANQGLGKWEHAASPKMIYYTADPSAAKSLASNHVYDIVEEKNGSLWISSFGGGLHYYNNTTGQISHVNGSPNLLEGLQTDNTGNVWMIASGELYQYDPKKQIFTPVQGCSREIIRKRAKLYYLFPSRFGAIAAGYQSCYIYRLQNIR